MKLIKLLLLSIILPAMAMAINEYDLMVNTPQEVDMYAALFDGIHYFFHGTTKDNYLSLLRTIVLFGTIMTMIKAAAAIAGGASGSGAIGASSLLGLASYQIFVVFMLSTLFARESQLIIKHPPSLTFDISATIPDVFGFTVSFFSELNYQMTAIAEDSFSDIRNQSQGQIYDINSYGENIGYGMTGLGYGGLPTILANTDKIMLESLVTETGESMSQMYRAYIKDCVIMPLSITQPTYTSVLINKPDLWTNISPAEIQNVTGFAGSSMLVQYAGQVQPCETLYTDMETLKNDILLNMEKRFGKELASLYYANYFMQGSFSGGSFGTTATTSNLIKDAAFAKAQLIDSAMANDYKGIFRDLGQSGNVFASGAGSSVAEIQQNGLGSGAFMSKFLPVFSSFIFMVMIAAFPFMFAFALLPGGFQIMIQFARTLAWVSLWSPMAAILNFFIDYRMMQQVKEFAFYQNNSIVIEDILPNPQMIDLSSEAATMAGLAGFLYLMVPGLSWMLVTGSGVMLSNITGALGGAFQKHSSGEAVAQKAEAAGAAAGANTTVAEQEYYASGARMAQTQAAYEGQKATYGDDFSAMASDQGKQVAQQHGQAQGAGSQMTLSQAAAGGQAQGKMSGAATKGMGELGVQMSDADLDSFGKVSAAKQVSAVTGASEVLERHDGASGMIKDLEVSMSTEAGIHHKQSEPLYDKKARDAYIAGKGKEIAQKTASTIAMGENENYSEDDARELGKSQGELEANKLAETVKKFDEIKQKDKHLEKVAKVLAGKDMAALKAIVDAESADNKPISASDQVLDIEAEAKKSVQDLNATMGKKGAGSRKAYTDASRTEAAHAGKKLKTMADITNSAEDMNDVVKQETQAYQNTVTGSNKMKKLKELKNKQDKLVKELEESIKTLEGIKNTDINADVTGKTSEKLLKKSAEKFNKEYKKIVESDMTGSEKAKALQEITMQRNKEFKKAEAIQTKAVAKREAEEELKSESLATTADKIVDIAKQFIDGKITKNEAETKTAAAWKKHMSVVDTANKDQIDYDNKLKKATENYEKASKAFINSTSKKTMPEAVQEAVNVERLTNAYYNRNEALGSVHVNQILNQVGQGQAQIVAGMPTAGMSYLYAGAGQFHQQRGQQDQMTAGGHSSAAAYYNTGRIKGERVNSVIVAANIIGDKQLNRMIAKGGSPQIYKMLGSGDPVGNMIAVTGSNAFKNNGILGDGSSISMTSGTDGSIGAQTITNDYSNLFTSTNVNDYATRKFNAITADSSIEATKTSAMIYDYSSKVVDFASKVFLGKNIVGATFKNIKGKTPLDSVLNNVIKINKRTNVPK